MCAAPKYLNRRGRQTHPSELTAHEAIVPPILSLRQGLTFQHGATGEIVIVKNARRPALAAVHINTMFAAALAALGIAGLPSFVIADALQ